MHSVWNNAVNHHSLNPGQNTGMASNSDGFSVASAQIIKWRFSRNGRVRARETGSYTEQATWPNPSISVALVYLYCYVQSNAEPTGSLIVEASSSRSCSKHTDAL